MEAAVLGVISALLGAGQFYYARKQYLLSKPGSGKAVSPKSMSDATSAGPRVRRPPLVRYLIATVFVVFGVITVIEPASTAGWVRGLLTGSW